MKRSAILVLAVIFSLCQASLYAQNGISMDVLQKDPYFSNGRTEQALEENPSSDIMKEDGMSHPNKQTIDPNDASTFYNAQNWPGYIPGMEVSPNPKAPAQQNQESTAKKPKNEAPFTVVNPNYQEEPTEEDYLFDYWRKSWFEANILYTPLYAPDFITPTTLGTLLGLNETNWLNFLGVMADAAFLPARFKYVKLGVGLNAGINWHILKKPQYTFYTNIVTTNGSLIMRIRMGTYASMDLFAGGGAMMFLDVKTTYANNYTTEPYNWIFANVMGGFGLQFYFTRMLGSDFRLQVDYPFKTDDPFPIVRFGAGIGVRL